MPNRLRAWLQLFRVPNLLTVPGDPLAGFLIATGGHLDSRAWVAVVASLCLYAAGLAMNDLADVKEDLRDRPARPLPSGAVGKGAAIIAVLALIGVAFGVLRLGAGPLAFMAGVLLLATVTFYNFLAKRIPFVGAIAMGACRGGSLLLGAAAGTPMMSEQLGGIATVNPLVAIALAPSVMSTASVLFTFALAGAVIVALYIAAVTALARHETNPSCPKYLRLLPLGVLLLGFLVLKQATGPLLLDQAPTLWLVAIVLCAMNTSQLMKVPPPPLAPRIGGFIRLLLVMQAALCLVPTVPTRLRKTPESFTCAVVLLALVPVNARLGRRFYAS